MPRKPRMYMAGMPCHVVQRGNNRDATFYSDDDYQFYLACLEDGTKRYRVAVHAFVLMTNHVHLVIDPGKDAENLALLMKRLAGRYTRYINKKGKRSGTVWEGRYKSSPVTSGEYLLACCRYVEQNPVRAGIADDPGQYHWSSYSTKIGVDSQQWIDLDSFYMSLCSNLAMHRSDVHSISNF